MENHAALAFAFAPLAFHAFFGAGSTQMRRGK